MLSMKASPHMLLLKLFKLGFRTPIPNFFTVASVIRISRKPKNVAWGEGKLYVCQVRESGKWRVESAWVSTPLKCWHYFSKYRCTGLQVHFSMLHLLRPQCCKSYSFSNAHRPFEWFPRLVSMFHILWMAATIGGSEIAFVSKAATLFSGFYSKFFSCFLAI